MARDESDREDLLREATALVERIELLPTTVDPSATDSTSAPPIRDATSIVVGFRANGAASFFFGSDPVYQFNSSGELRRAYCDGLLFKAANGRLVSLDRVRTVNEVELRRSELTAEEQRELLARLCQRLNHLTTLLANDQATVIGQVPADGDIRGRVEKWLADHQAIAVASAPNA